MNAIDLRSDTVTMPTPAMREAMSMAPVGDDVYGEDPTINALQAKAAQLTGKEAALFVASGTMGNLVAMLTHATRGEEVILGQDAHIYKWENGSMASLGGIIPRPLPTDERGCMNLDQVEAAVRFEDDHFPYSRLILVENSYGAKNGMPIAPDYLASIRAIANRHQLRVHMDGARLFNAAVALKLPASALVQYVDSVSFCLSKGLCAPVGSLLCGSADFIKKARRVRKSLGGGMRQAGILAAAGLIALDSMIDRLAEDHVHAKQLAKGLTYIPDIVVDIEHIHTNIVYFSLVEDCHLDAPALAQKVKEDAGILIGAEDKHTIRAVTHYWVGQDEVTALLQAIRSALN